MPAAAARPKAAAGEPAAAACASARAALPPADAGEEAAQEEEPWEARFSAPAPSCPTLFCWRSPAHRSPSPHPAPPPPPAGRLLAPLLALLLGEVPGGLRARGPPRPPARPREAVRRRRPRQAAAPGGPAGGSRAHGLHRLGRRDRLRPLPRPPGHLARPVRPPREARRRRPHRLGARQRHRPPRPLLRRPRRRPRRPPHGPRRGRGPPPGERGHQHGARPSPWRHCARRARRLSSSARAPRSVRPAEPSPPLPPRATQRATQVAVRELRWGDRGSVEAARRALGAAPDLVLGSDLVYRMPNVEPLLATLLLAVPEGAAAVRAPRRLHLSPSRLPGALRLACLARPAPTAPGSSSARRPAPRQILAVDRQHCPEAVELFQAEAAASFEVEARSSRGSPRPSQQAARLSSGPG